MRRFSLVFALTGSLLAVACAPPAPVTPAAPPPETGGLHAVAGAWAADKSANLRAKPGVQAAVIGQLRAGEPVKVLGRVGGGDWMAIDWKGRTGYVRLDLLRLIDQPTTRAGSTSVLPKPTDNAGPNAHAAPRAKIEAAPIPPT